MLSFNNKFAVIGAVAGAVGGAVLGNLLQKNVFQKKFAQELVQELPVQAKAHENPAVAATPAATTTPPITPSKELQDLLHRFLPKFAEDPVFQKLYESVTVLEYLDQDSFRAPEGKYKRTELQYRAKILTDVAQKMIRQMKTLAFEKRVNPIDFKQDIGELERVIQDSKKNILQHSLILRG